MSINCTDMSFSFGWYFVRKMQFEYWENITVTSELFTPQNVPDENFDFIITLIFFVNDFIAVYQRFTQNIFCVSTVTVSSRNFHKLGTVWILMSPSSRKSWARHWHSARVISNREGVKFVLIIKIYRDDDYVKCFCAHATRW